MIATCTFFTVVEFEDKQAAIKNLLTLFKQGTYIPEIVIIKPEEFRKVPGTPFAYWVSSRIRELFVRLPKFEGEGGSARVGLQSSDDFRFVRVWWEVTPSKIISGNKNENQKFFIDQTFKNKKWVVFEKGGDYRPYFEDLKLLIDWEKDGEIIKTWVVNNPTDPKTSHWSRNIRSHENYFIGGYYQTLRAVFFAPHITPNGCIFSHNGFQIFSKLNTFYLLGFFNSTLSDFLFKILLGSTDTPLFTAGAFQKIPFIMPAEPNKIAINSINIFNKTRQIFQYSELEHIFLHPLFIAGNINLTTQINNWLNLVNSIEIEITENSQCINNCIYEIYRIPKEDQIIINKYLLKRPSHFHNIETDPTSFVFALCSYLLGCVFGRWDIRYVTSEKQPPPLPDPFDPLPVCSPGMLQGDDGLPLTESPSSYPLNIQWNGILVEDPGHTDDIIQKVREVLRVIYGEQSEAFEAEACSILGIANLGEYFKRISAKGFFDDHIKKYSKSRRKVPIYWKLSSDKGNYSIWLYYHRITRDTPFQVLKYIEDKINLENSSYEDLKQRKDREKDSLPKSQLTKLGKEIESKAEFINELKDFRKKIDDIAKNGYDPDFDDGVILNMAPLYEVIPWKEPKAYWEDLEKGKYDWAHIAMKYWPDRVKERCRKDKSIAIAHGQEHLYEAD